MNLRSLVARPVRWALARAGKEIISKEDIIKLKERYGIDPLRDIERLSQTWKYSTDLFFDVGANCGGTIWSVRKTFENCQIVAFEPHPETFSKLKELMKSTKKIDLVNVALGSKIGNMTMFEYGENDLNSLVQNAQYAVRFGEKARQITIICTTIDKFCSERDIRAIDVLKIDTEGYDLEVLKGARSMLDQQAIKFIYFEFNDIRPRSDAFGGALAPIDEWIRPRGYRFIASYIDYVVPEGDLFLVANALYALPPK